MKYMIVLEKTRTGFSAYCPDLPGCIATGRTRGAVERRMKQALEMHLEGLASVGQKRPMPHSFSSYVDIPT